ncbi:MAG: hypothetical protein V2A55_02945 [Candidatus Jorgensenbacteria bacterium]
MKFQKTYSKSTSVAIFLFFAAFVFGLREYYVASWISTILAIIILISSKPEVIREHRGRVLGDDEEPL